MKKKGIDLLIRLLAHVTLANANNLRFPRFFAIKITSPVVAASQVQKYTFLGPFGIHIVLQGNTSSFQTKVSHKRAYQRTFHYSPYPTTKYQKYLAV